MRNLIILLLALAISFSTVGAAIAADDYRPEIAAHRGASGYLPEHTLASKAMAYALSVDYIEQDCLVTRDGIPIVLHDLTLQRTTNSAAIFGGTSHPAANYTLAQIKQLTVQSPNSARFPQGYRIDFRVNTLEEELLLIQGINKATGKEIGIYPECKSGNTSAWPSTDNIEPIIEVLKKYGYNHPDSKCYLQSFNLHHLVRARDDYGWVGKTVFLGIPSATQLNRFEGGWVGLRKYVDVLSPTHSSLTTTSTSSVVAAGIVTARQHGMKIHTYTHNNTAVSDQNTLFNRLFSIVKVDGVFTDFPDHVSDHLIRNGWRNGRVEGVPYTGGEYVYKPKVAAHRGASGYLPEHTKEGVAMAYGMGADFIEPDVQITSDGVPIVLHDPTLQRTTNVAEVFPDRHRSTNAQGVRQYFAGDFTLAEIKQLKVTESINRNNGTPTYPGRFPIGPEYDFFTIPTLEEFIILVQGMNFSTSNQRSPAMAHEVGIYPETKYDIHNNNIKPVIDLLTRYGYNRPDAKCLLQSFDFEHLIRARDDYGWVGPTVFLPSAADMLSKEGIARVAEYADIYAPTIANLLEVSDFGWIPHERVQWARDKGMDIHTWTYRTDALGLQGRFTGEELLDVLFKAIRVDGMFTDFTDVVVNYLYDNNMRGVAAQPTKKHSVISAGSVVGANGTVNMTVTPEGSGVIMSNAVSGASGFTVMYEEDAELKLTLSATPKNGHAFIGWFENNKILSNVDAVYTFNATAKNRMLEARFSNTVYVEAWVTKDKNGPNNTLTIVVHGVDVSGCYEAVVGEASFIIGNNVENTYNVAGYKVYVKTTGRDKIEKCYFVK